MAGQDLPGQPPGHRPAADGPLAEGPDRLPHEGRYDPDGRPGEPTAAENPGQQGDPANQVRE